MPTKKDNGLGKPLRDAINHLIEKGVYGKILARWGLTSDGVSTSRLNPSEVGRARRLVRERLLRWGL
ncbi:hypothetical protein ACFV4L_37200, partial [Streptomyces antimycoticus]